MLRLHIRANSNAECDQAVKLKVRDAVNAYLCDSVRASSFDAAYAEVRVRLGRIASVARGALEDNGFFYGASARLDREHFPERTYGERVVPEGDYDALIIELGAAAGDNWWCVVYPPLCYGTSFEYKSFFAELFGGAA